MPSTASPRSRRPRPGKAVGTSVGAPAATDVVTGRAEFTMDTEMEGMLHLKVLHSPHAHARIVSIDKTAALAVPGVHRVYTWEDVPRKRYTTAIHTDHLVDPDDTYILDNVVRFVGQRVVAVLADSVGAAEEGCRKVVVEYEVLPAVFDPEEAMADGAPQLHGSDDPFVRDPVHNILLELHGEIGDVEAGFAEADVIHEGTYFSPRVQHAHLETHGSIAWMEDGRLNVRTSSQSPSIAKGQAVASVRPAPRPAPGVLQARRRRLRRQAGGDLRGSGRAGHPGHRAAGLLRVHPRGGVHHRLAAASDDGDGQARREGRRHAHGVPGPQCVEHRRLRQPRRRDAVRRRRRRHAIYRCPNKKFDAFSVYTNTVPSGALRGYGMTQPAFAVESAMDELALALDMDPLELRRRNIVRPGDALLAIGEHPDDVMFTEDGLDAVHRPGRRRPAPQQPTGMPSAPEWLVGTGTASSLHETAPPTEHISEAWATLRDDGIYEIAVGTVEFGEGTSTAHVQIAASQLGTTPSRMHLVQSDTDRTGFDTGAFASAGLFVVGQRGAAGRRPRCATASCDSPPRTPASTLGMCSMDDDGVICGDPRVPLAELVAAARARGSGSPTPARPTAHRAA